MLVFLLKIYYFEVTATYTSAMLEKIGLVKKNRYSLKAPRDSCSLLFAGLFQVVVVRLEVSKVSSNNHLFEVTVSDTFTVRGMSLCGEQEYHGLIKYASADSYIRSNRDERYRKEK